MTIALIRTALETRLGTMSPALSTAFENVSFTPVVGTAYQMLFLLPAEPDNSTIGSNDNRFERGIFQLSLMYPQNVGPGAAQARALAAQAHFNRGRVLTASAVNVLILRTPYIHAGRKDGDRWRVDIDITYQAQVFA